MQQKTKIIILVLAISVIGSVPFFKVANAQILGGKRQYGQDINIEEDYLKSIDRELKDTNYKLDKIITLLERIEEK